jgi:hypothetical protein
MKFEFKERAFLYSIMAMILVTTFWSLWYCVTGSVPITTEFNWNNTQEDGPWNLSITMSRWWDIYFAPIWVLILIPIFSHRSKEKEPALLISFILSFVITVMYSLFFNKCDYKLMTIMLIAPTLYSNLEKDLSFFKNLIIVLSLTCGISLYFGLYYGLGIGLLSIIYFSTYTIPLFFIFWPLTILLSEFIKVTPKDEEEAT